MTTKRLARILSIMMIITAPSVGGYRIYAQSSDSLNISAPDSISVLRQVSDSTSVSDSLYIAAADSLSISGSLSVSDSLSFADSLSVKDSLIRVDSLAFVDSLSISDSLLIDTTAVREKWYPPFALKTNLLFDAVTALNVELEVPLSPHWSVDAEWMFPWWLAKSNKFCFEVLSGNLEFRFWTGNRKRMLGGYFIGLYAGGGLYDFQWLDRGYQGEFYVASGISTGYCFNIGESFNLEVSIGAGYLVTNYRHYKAVEDYSILAYQYDGRFTWLGPTKMKLSLVWLIGQKHYNRKGR